MFSVSRKRVVITGAAGNMGAALSYAFRNASALVLGIDIKFDSANASSIQCDLGDESQIDVAVKKIEEVLGRVDVLINCAGITIEGDSSSDFQKTLNINLIAPFLLSKKVVPLMKDNGGSIINVTSLNAHLAFPNNPAYIASKGALKQLTRSFAYDYGKYKIRVNNIVPGYIKTDMTRNSWDNPTKRKERENRTLLERWGEPKDIVGPALFLASDASSYITGIDLLVDGGWSAKGI